MHVDTTITSGPSFNAQYIASEKPNHLLVWFGESYAHNMYKSKIYHPISESSLPFVNCMVVLCGIFY